MQTMRINEAIQAYHYRYYHVAGITIQVKSDIEIDDRTFHNKFTFFRAEGPGEDTVTICHHFGFPELSVEELGQKLYDKAPWAIYRNNGFYLYLGISSQSEDPTLHRVVNFSADHTRADIYNDDIRKSLWIKGDLPSLTMFPSDQILIARLLGDRRGCYLHSSGVILNGCGVLFVGRSGAGKTTAMELLIESGATGEMSVEHLCEDRNIVRRLNSGWMVYGTWNHYDRPRVSSSSAPLRMICFLEQARENTLTKLSDHKEITRRVLESMIKPFVTADWWEKSLNLIEMLAQEVPCYIMKFDKSEKIAREIAKLTEGLDQPNH